MARRKGSLLRQLTLGLSLAIVFLSLASFYYQYRVQRHILTTSISSDLRRQAGLLRSWLEHAETEEERQAVSNRYFQTLEYIEKARQEVVVVDAECRIVATNTERQPGNEYSSSSLTDALRPGVDPGGLQRVIDGQAVCALPLYATSAHRNIAGALLLRQPLTAVDALADSLMFGAFTLLATTLLIIVLVVHVVLRLKVHKPMQAIFMQEYRIREGDLARIDAEDPSNEFSDLYAMYNEMVVRIAEQKKAILEQKDHVALAQLARQAIARVTPPLDEILSRSRALLEGQSSLSEDDRMTLKVIIGNITRIARELKALVVAGDKSAGWLKREADKIRDYDQGTGENKDGDKYVLE